MPTAHAAKTSTLPTRSAATQRKAALEMQTYWTAPASADLDDTRDESDPDEAVEETRLFGSARTLTVRDEEIDLSDDDADDILSSIRR